MHRGLIGARSDAEVYLERSVAAFQAAGNAGGGSAMAFMRWGQVARANGDRSRANAYFRASVEHAWDARDLWALPNALEGSATVADLKRAARLCGAAEALRESTGNQVSRALARPEHWRTIEDLRARLSEPTVAAAWSAGRALSLGEAVAEALALPPSGKELAGTPDELTSREREVLRLLTEGLTDAEIGHVLFISPHTVATHVKRILAKLAVGSRAAAVGVAFRRGLV
jgi:DNA-binding CsgD family transcriptional regulator